MYFKRMMSATRQPRASLQEKETGKVIQGIKIRFLADKEACCRVFEQLTAGEQSSDHSNTGNRPSIYCLGTVHRFGIMMITKIVQLSVA